GGTGRIAHGALLHCERRLVLAESSLVQSGTPAGLPAPLVAVRAELPGWFAERVAAEQAPRPADPITGGRALSGGTSDRVNVFAAEATGPRTGGRPGPLPGATRGRAPGAGGVAGPAGSGATILG